MSCHGPKFQYFSWRIYCLVSNQSDSHPHRVGPPDLNLIPGGNPSLAFGAPCPAGLELVFFLGEWFLQIKVGATFSENPTFTNGSFINRSSIHCAKLNFHFWRTNLKTAALRLPALAGSKLSKHLVVDISMNI